MDLTGSSTVRIPIDPEDLSPAPEAVARYFGGSDYQLNPKTHQRICEGIHQAVGIVKPVVSYRAIPVEKIESVYEIVLSDGTCADILPDPMDDPIDDHRDDQARYLAVYVGTLGSALETTCRDLAKHGRLYESLLLDAVGTAMLDAMASLCDDFVDIHSRQLGLFTGCRLGPGLNGIALESQALIFELLGGESAGVHLNEAFIMRPAKSISAFVIYSDSEQRKNPGSKCLQCEMKHCQFRSTRHQ